MRRNPAQAEVELPKDGEKKGQKEEIKEAVEMVQTECASLQKIPIKVAKNLRKLIKELSVFAPCPLSLPK